MTDDIQIKLEKRRRVFKEIPQYHDTNLKVCYLGSSHMHNSRCHYQIFQ